MSFPLQGCPGRASRGENSALPRSRVHTLRSGRTGSDFVGWFLFLSSRLLTQSGCAQNSSHCFAQSLPVRSLGSELLATGLSQFVIFCAAIVLRSSPLGFDPTLLLHAIERRIERTLLDFQDLVGRLLNPLCNLVSVQRPARERSQNEHRQSPLQQVRF